MAGYIAAGAQIFGALSKYAAHKKEQKQDEIYGQIAENQSLLEEGMQRREARESLGRTSAAIGESGTGYGGSSANVMDQAAINAEMDALNIRFKGQFAKYGYTQQGANERGGGRDALISGGLGAGAAYLNSRSNAYTG